MYTFDENINRIEQAKADIKRAIEEKGVFVGGGNINTYANKIKMIKSSGKTQAKTETITENNSVVSITADDGYILDKVTVITEIPIESKSVEYNRNGNYTITPEEGVEGYDNINVNVNVPIQSSKRLSVNSNGVYYATPDDADTLGIAKVEIDVDVPLQEKEISISTNGTYNITPDDEYEGISDLTLKVNVKADGGKPIIPNGIFFKGSTWETFDMGEYDWSYVYNWTNMFYECRKLKTIENFPENARVYGSVKSMFYSTTNIVELPYFDTTEVSNIRSFCYNCQKIKTIPQYNFENVTNCEEAFSNCGSLTDIPRLNFKNVTNTKNMLSYSRRIINLGGFTDIKCNLDLSGCNSLIYESIMNVINDLYDFNDYYAEPTSEQGTLKLSSTLLSMLSEDDIKIATDKKWKITV